MSTQPNTAYLTGTGMPYAGAPKPGWCFADPDGSVSPFNFRSQGYTLCYQVHLGSWLTINEVIVPEVTLPVGAPPGTPYGGLQAMLLETTSDPDLAQLSMFAATLGPPFEDPGVLIFGHSQGDGLLMSANQGSDYIVMQSYVPDSSLYYSGWADNVVSGAMNGYFPQQPSATERDSIGPNDPSFFAIGGLSPGLDALFNSNDEVQYLLSGMRTVGLAGMWITPGVPSLDQAATFMEQSMEAGRIVPMPFNPVRTMAGVQPPPPSSPQGFWWDAADLPKTLKANQAWTDKISGYELTLQGLGELPRLYAREPIYTLHRDIFDVPAIPV